jgi:anthranilate synthase component 1
MEKIRIISSSTEIDLKNPPEAYRAIKGPNTYLLESTEGSDRVARYSFIGYNPKAKITAKGAKVEYSASVPELRKIDVLGETPLKILKNTMKQFENTYTETKLRFCGGFVGYLSYDYIRSKIELGNRSTDDLDQPDAEFVLTGNNIIFDHFEGKTYLLIHDFLRGKDVSDKEKIEKALKTAELELLHRIKENKGNNYIKKLKTSYYEPLSNTKKDDFVANVNKAKEYIRAGDIFQVVLSQRFSVPFRGDDFRIYSVLKKINPSPYMYFLDFGERKVIGSSPEMLVRVEGRRVETYPIAGTKPRGKTHEEDLFFEKVMCSDEKELAEHVMLVDLGRNDLGRVSKYGSVKVERFMDVEKYSHVQHMVSQVSGVLREECDEFDALDAVFPAGTVSGAPKVRAMEIIEELEPTHRGIYAGAIGYFSFNHNLDTAISIRTIILEKDRAYIQAGAGIVADSNPESEFQETINKASGLLKALKEAQ